jgi:hypothetical protein
MTRQDKELPKPMEGGFWAHLAAPLGQKKELGMSKKLGEGLPK